MTDFTIGKPTTPPERPKKYEAIWQSVDLLTDGDAVPVAFTDDKDARNFYSLSSYYKRYRFTRRGLVVYVSKREVTP